MTVARRFARAYLSYEVAELGPAATRAISAGSTPSFARTLRSRHAVLPPGVGAARVRQTLAGVVPLWHLPGRAVVLVTVGPAGRAGAFQLTLVPRSGRWRVAGMAVY